MGRQLGIEDPEQWLEDCPERVFDSWYASYRCEPWGGEREMLARIASLLYLIACKGGVKLEDVSKASDAITNMLMPPDWIGKRTNEPKIDIKQVRQGLEQFERVAEKLFG